MKEKTLNNAVGPINSSKYSDESGTSAQSFSFSNVSSTALSCPLGNSIFLHEQLFDMLGTSVG